MPDNGGYPPNIGMGECLACGRKIKVGMLMCWPDWQKVPKNVQRSIYAALDQWNNGNITLGQLREEQMAATRWTGVRE